MGRRSLLVVGLALALVFAAPAFGDDIEDKAAVDARIATLQAEIAASKQQEGVLTSQLSAVVTELGAAQAAVEEAQSSLGVLEAELAAEQERLARLTASCWKNRRVGSDASRPNTDAPSGSSRRESGRSTSRSHLTLSRSSSRPRASTT